MKSFEIISNEYYSNCVIEALKAKIKDPKKIKIYFCKPRITENKHFQMFHFMWSDGKADYDFSDLHDGEMPWYQDFIFKGAIRKFDLGFAKRYTEMKVIIFFIYLKKGERKENEFIF